MQYSVERVNGTLSVSCTDPLKRIKDLTQALLKSGADWRKRHIEILDKDAHLCVHVGGGLKIKAAAGQTTHAKKIAAALSST
jgi:hypothetical protein